MKRPSINIAKFLSFWQKILEFLKLWPLSLAEKCRLAFGTAVVGILALALLLPYIWMGQLVRKGLLDTNGTKAKVLLMRTHFQPRESIQGELQPLR